MAKTAEYGSLARCDRAPRFSANAPIRAMRCLTLPISASMTLDDADDVIEAFGSVYG
jgi:hypothetical protein